VSTRLRVIRHERGLSQAQLAERAGVATRTIYSAEHGRRCLYPTQRRILRALGVAWEKRSSVFP
jgi:transcriptional regulator with XRE-family HTH domain